MKNSVSIIIPNYNKSAWIESCIESCMIQGGYLKEIIIVDDQSKDDSWEIIQKLKKIYAPKIRIYINPVKGANQARNYGFDKSQGNFIQWLDSDDELLKGKFEKQLPFLVDGQADIAYSDWKIRHYEQGKLFREEEKYYDKFDDFLLELLKDNWTSPNNYLMTRETAQNLHQGIGWNPETPVGQDREYFTMAGILGARFIYVPGIYAVYNQQRQGSISSMQFKERLMHNQRLESRFRKEIDKSSLISRPKKELYFRILNTHKIKACFYDHRIQLERFVSPFDIEWSLAHWKMRCMLPFTFAKKNLEHLMKKNFYPNRGTS